MLEKWTKLKISASENRDNFKWRKKTKGIRVTKSLTTVSIWGGYLGRLSLGETLSEKWINKEKKTIKLVKIKVRKCQRRGASYLCSWRPDFGICGGCL